MLSFLCTGSLSAGCLRCCTSTTWDNSVRKTFSISCCDLFRPTSSITIIYQQNWVDTTLHSLLASHAVLGYFLRVTISLKPCSSTVVVSYSSLQTATTTVQKVHFQTIWRSSNSLRSNFSFHCAGGYILVATNAVSYSLEHIHLIPQLHLECLAICSQNLKGGLPLFWSLCHWPESPLIAGKGCICNK